MMSVHTYESDEGKIERYIGTNLKYKHKILWPAVGVVLLINVFGVVGLYKVFKGEVKSETLWWGLFLAIVGHIGVSVGTHRYFSHKSFKATPLLEVIFMLMQTLAGQNHIFVWCKDHRQHHRYSDTDGDPLNAKRSIFFAYVGWVITKRNKYVKELGKNIYMRDLISNKVVMFQKRHYLKLFLLVTVAIPTLVSVYWFNESWLNSLLVAYFLRHALYLHYSWSVVLFGHRGGIFRPYEKNIQPVDSWIVGLVTGGDGNHNFHHVFPWDYKSSEEHNFLSLFIKLCGYLGLAYDLKAATSDMVNRKINKSGDGTHKNFGTNEVVSTDSPNVVMRILGPKDVFSFELHEMEDTEVWMDMSSLESASTFNSLYGMTLTFSFNCWVYYWGLGQTKHLC